MEGPHAGDRIVISFTPADAEVGERVDVALAARAEITRTAAQRALKQGLVTVNGGAVRPSYRLEPGDDVGGELPEVAVAAPEPEDIPLTVRFSDEHLLVISKPPGLVTHPARGHESGTLVNALLGLGGSLSNRNSVRPGIVHRLDKDTSGLLLVARDDDTQEALVEAIRRREVERRYLALVRGVPGSASGTIEAPVGRHPTKRRQMAVVAGGKPSVTHYEVLADSEGRALLDVTLGTGRTHQIRVHLSHLGHPVLGDRVYGGHSQATRALGLDRPFLHAWRLAFVHPVTGAEVAVTDPLPEDLKAVLEAAGIHDPLEA
ncbi:MAG TPA: RluA family pseudouridine synthase [Actinomycetota bacterium]|nr:RluA family pseudouridine synthase [Actinomycetota bacterium]